MPLVNMVPYYKSKNLCIHGISSNTYHKLVGSRITFNPSIDRKVVWNKVVVISAELLIYNIQGSHLLPDSSKKLCALNIEHTSFFANIPLPCN